MIAQALIDVFTAFLVCQHSESCEASALVASRLVIASLRAPSEVHAFVICDHTLIYIETPLFGRVRRIELKAWIAGTLVAANVVCATVTASTILNETLIDIFAGGVAR